MRLLALCILLLAGPCLARPAAAAADPAFAAWLAALRAEALEKGISRATVDRALEGVEPIARIVELDRAQPEFTQTFWDYVGRRVTPERVAVGRDRLAAHRALLNEIAQSYGVQPRFLVAFWGLESNYGRHTGDYPVIAALVTLAFDRRRAEFFRVQLLEALEILDQGNVAPERMRGSWAGAMGHVQFIPSTFLHYAVDHDGDGRRDIWDSLPDALASAANYLASIGWDNGQTWGREVRLPSEFAWDLAGLEQRKTTSEWHALGVRLADGRDLPADDPAGSIIAPGGHRGPAFLVFDNFRTILRWNRSLLYAVSVGVLADRIAGAPPLVSEPASDVRPLSRPEVVELQKRLRALGFDPGAPDGIVGARTRSALRAFQHAAGLPADGFPTFETLKFLRQRDGI